MSTQAECAKCQHAEWSRTPTGRIKQKVPGRCKVAPPPRAEAPLLCLVQPPAWHKVAIWPDYKGRCDSFKDSSSP